ncbi:hypothetical protein REC12_11700 [Desulfosporosinus sp. PR]|nr:hypothetical protein [Desulfosporosinus sp. PR]
MKLSKQGKQLKTSNEITRKAGHADPATPEPPSEITQTQGAKIIAFPKRNLA